MLGTGTSEIYRKDPELEKLLRGKRIAFVGPSPHLSGTGLGGLIDSYDVVARVNQESPIPCDRTNDYGRRMEVLVAACNTHNLTLLKEQIDADAEYMRNLKYVICTQSTVDNDGIRVDRAFQKINKNNVPFHIIGDSFADHIDEVVGCETNTGFNGILTFLKYPIRELFVAGFSFYNMGHGGKVWYDEAFDDRVKLGIIEDDPGKVFETPSHVQQPQIDYFVKLVNRYPNILTIDPYLRNNLPMNHNSGGGLSNTPTVVKAQSIGKPNEAWKLEIAITDYCNLSCSLCSQGTPLQKDKKTMSTADLEEISRNIRPYEFDVIKISGGEPTLHPQFGEICGNLKRLFQANRYELATNGFRLEQFKDAVGVFDNVDLGYYPGKNDAIVERFRQFRIANVNIPLKRDGVEMVDVHQEKNLNKEEVYDNCAYAGYRKIVQGRIYPCCVIFGQAMRQNIDLNEISVSFDSDWRENLAKIDIEDHCRRCFIDVKAPMRMSLPTVSPVAGGITIFAMPKAFRGHFDVIQRNALRSWMLLEPKPEIILLGNDAGVGEVAREFGLVHVPDVRCNSLGTPLVSDIFGKAEMHASNDIMMYINSDIILLSDFMPAVREVSGRFDKFLVTGQRWDADITEALAFDMGGWEENLRQYVVGNAFLHWPTGMDYFVFNRGLWSDIPDLAIGRMAWDSWLVGKPIDDGQAVVDATEMVMAIHQDHECVVNSDRRQEEVVHNRQLAGAVTALGSTSCAAWKLTSYGVIPRHAGDFLKNPNASVAFTCLDRAYRQNPEIIKKQFEHFMRCTFAGKLNSMLGDAKVHLLSEPDNIAAKLVVRHAGGKDTETAIELFNRGLGLLRAGSAAEAVVYLNQVLTYSVELPNLHYALAVAFAQSGDLPAAKRACERELAGNPANEGARKLIERLAGAGYAVTNQHPGRSTESSRF
jgi:hypothetical protein